jgi:hypothetical protein
MTCASTHVKVKYTMKSSQVIRHVKIELVGVNHHSHWGRTPPAARPWSPGHLGAHFVGAYTAWLCPSHQPLMATGTVFRTDRLHLYTADCPRRLYCIVTVKASKHEISFRHEFIIFISGMPSYCSDLNSYITSSSQTRSHMRVPARRKILRHGSTRTSMYLELMCQQVASVASYCFSQ